MRSRIADVAAMSAFEMNDRLRSDPNRPSRLRKSDVQRIGSNQQPSLARRRAVRAKRRTKVRTCEPKPATVKCRRAIERTLSQWELNDISLLTTSAAGTA